jgi:hypothetical protein
MKIINKIGGTTMLIEAHKLLSILEEMIPFKTTFTLSLDEDKLVLQALFEKDKSLYYYLETFSLEKMSNNQDDDIDTITTFIQKLEEFYTNIDTEELQKSEIIGQIVDWKGEK